MIEFETFLDMFVVLLNAYGKSDDDNKLAGVYYEILSRTAPTPEETWEAIVQCIEHRPGYGFPSGQDLKQVIWDMRKQQQVALPATPDPVPEPYEESDAKLYRTIVLAQIFKGQGDTAFYRSMLSGVVKPGIAGVVAKIVPAANVTHEDVMDYIERELNESQPKKRSEIARV